MRVDNKPVAFGHGMFLHRRYYKCFFSVDATFNLGLFSVTPVTYQNLLIEIVRNKSSPIMLGSVLIHQTKMLRSFHNFVFILIRLNPNLSGLKAYGTDGEPGHLNCVFLRQCI